jgi:uncharacterized repeat protein (TIGR03803 family)
VPNGNLVLESGNLYGTTAFGGGVGYLGTLFELSPNGAGGWNETFWHSFNNSVTDAGEPLAGLISDPSGNLYGTSYQGGTYGQGTVFKFTPAGAEQILYNFGNGNLDGAKPFGGLVFDASGNLYGTTEYGGYSARGTVYELTPQADGTWTEKILYTFHQTTDGPNSPGFSLAIDGSGNLYGVTTLGGPNGGYGTVFELSPQPGGGWTARTLHIFHNDGVDGYLPNSNVSMDASGNLYGTTNYGGSGGGGVVYQLMRKSNGAWGERIVHNFPKIGKSNGAYASGVIVGPSGNLYGTAIEGGPYGAGIAFELVARPGGGWAEKILHSFINDGHDAANPDGAMIFDASGNLYGTATGGGTYNRGAVFEIKP